jgi:hypothetical protein
MPESLPDLVGQVLVIRFESSPSGWVGAAEHQCYHLQLVSNMVAIDCRAGAAVNAKQIATTTGAQLLCTAAKPNDKACHGW